LHHYLFQINHQLDATVSPSLLFDIYLQLNMFRASSRPSSGAYKLQQQPLVYRRNVVVAVMMVVVGQAGPIKTNSTAITTHRR